MDGPDSQQFARRPSEAFQRLALFCVFATPIIIMCVFVMRLAYYSLIENGGYRWLAIPCALFTAFMIFLLFYMSKTLRMAIASRHEPLVVLDRDGITLNRANPVIVPWTEITGASLEQGYRGSTTLLRLDVQDPTISEAGARGMVLDLRALSDQPAYLLATIQSHLRY